MKSLAIQRIVEIRDIIPKNSNIEKRLIIGFFGLIITLAISYGYFVKQTISNIVLREQINEEASDLGSSVSSLEVKYIELKNKINLDFAYSLGYKDVSEVKFVAKNTLSKNLTLNNN